MPLSSGTQLGPYEIVALIGAGGMGEVYKARDTRLDRIVAIKVSNEKFSERFEREARAVAALNHPHICTLHDVGPDYLVMELIEGAPLKGPLPLNQALKYATQICDALDAAHSKGITHRDLKPANILVTKAGVKLLDFGLAKQNRGRAGAVIDATLTDALTSKGQILGTLQYMSPEQLHSQEADPRSDIFSFGLVFYEMLTGKRAFEGSSPASVIAAILEREAPSVSDVAPAPLDRALRMCLAKDPERRWQSARDLKAELEWIAATDPARSPVISRRAMLPWFAGAAVAGAAGAVGLASLVRRGTSSPPRLEAIRYRLAAPEGAWLERGIARQSLALSPVGKRLAMIATNDKGSMVWVQRLDSLTASPLTGTEGANMLFWSPDGESIGFWAGGKMKKISAEGGTPLPICNVDAQWSATWNQEGTIVTSGGSAGISISVNGSTRELTTLRWPRFLPDGKRVLYVNMDPKIRGGRAYVLELSSGHVTELMPADTHAIFVPDQPGHGTASSQGYLLFGRSATLLALRFDADRLQASGEPVPVAQAVPFFVGNGWSEFDASSDGVLIYSTGSQMAQLTWLNRAGRDLGTVGEPHESFGFFRISPDGRRVVMDVFDFSSGAADVWVHDLSRGTAERVTYDSGSKVCPVWSPDGTRIAFAKPDTGTPQLRVKTVSDRGGGEHFPPGAFQLPRDWSSDGRWIFYSTTGGDVNGEIWVASTGERKIMPLLQTRFDSAFPILSPDGNYLAFSANDTGRYEIYVQRFEASDSPKLTGERRRVSLNGGNSPRWRRDGKELFFVSPDHQIMSVAVQQAASIEFGAPATLFRLPSSFRSLAPVTPGYDVSLDGQKFLVLTRGTASAPLQVAVNWQATLKR